MREFFSIAIIICALVISIYSQSVAGSNAALRTTLLEFKPTDFTSSAGEKVEAETAWLTVNETHSDSASLKIKLPVLRFKSTGAKTGFPIVYLAGGPGNSGLDGAKGEIFPIIQTLRQYGDVVIFDQRGTGAAEPSLKIVQKFALPLDSLLVEPSSRNYLIEQTKIITDDFAKRGINLSAYNTSENAEDIEDLRQMLGAEKLIVWGHSYGSHLGLAYLKKHPKAVDKIILSGINGLDQRWRFGSNLDDLIEQIDSYIASNTKFKQQMPSLKKTIETVFTRLDKQPFTVQLQDKTVKIGKLELQTLVALRSGDSAFVKMLPMMFGQMQAGDFNLAAQMVAGVIKQHDWGTAMAYSMHIASGVSPVRLQEIQTNAKSSLFGDALNFPFNDKDFVAAWQVADLGEDFRSLVKSDVPALFMSSNLDGRTSPKEAMAIAQNFSNVQQLLLSGASHNFYQENPEILTAIQNFLENKKVPSKIELPFELRNADERKTILQLRGFIEAKGINEGIKKLKEMAKPDSDDYLSSYHFGNLGLILLRDDKKPKEALEVFKAGTEIFPENLFLNERLADAFEANGMIENAISQYKKCLELNKLNRRPAVKIAELEKNK